MQEFTSEILSRCTAQTCCDRGSADNILRCRGEMHRSPGRPRPPSLPQVSDSNRSKSTSTSPERGPFKSIFSEHSATHLPVLVSPGRGPSHQRQGQKSPAEQRRDEEEEGPTGWTVRIPVGMMMRTWFEDSSPKPTFAGLPFVFCSCAMAPLECWSGRSCSCPPGHGSRQRWSESSNSTRR